MAVFGDRILRCSDGHLFVSSESSRLFGSVHMGPFRKMQCPVDGKIVTCGNVREASLTPEQLEEARRYKTCLMRFWPPRRGSGGLGGSPPPESKQPPRSGRW